MNWARCLRSVVFAFGLIPLTLVTAVAADDSAKRPIRVGIMLPLTGPFAGQSKEEIQGWDLAIKSMGGSIEGHPVETVVVDTAGDPNKAITLARQLVEVQRVDVIFGPLASNESSATKPYLKSVGIPTMFPACDIEPVPGTVVSNVLQTGHSCFVIPLMFGDYAYKEMKDRRITIVAGDFSYGWQTVGGFIAAFQKAGGVVDKIIWTPITLSDYSPYVSQIPSNTDAVFAVLVGAQTIRFIQAYKGFGLTGKIPLIGADHVTDYSVLPALPEDAVDGVVTAGTYVEGLPNSENKKFVDAFKASAGRYPSWFGETAYSSALLLAAGLKQVGGDVTKRADLIAAMKSVTLDTPHGPMKIDAETNSPLANVYIAKVNRVNGELLNVPIYTFSNVAPWGLLSKEEWAEVAKKDSAARPAPR
jgi:branched-chain amino acid transport system substrate-binding protein